MHPRLFALVFLVACAPRAPIEGPVPSEAPPQVVQAPTETPPAQAPRSIGDAPVDPASFARPAGLAPEITWPEEALFLEHAKALPRPWTLVLAHKEGVEEPWLALAAPGEDGWEVGALLGEGSGRPEGCRRWPCPWPADLTPAAPLEQAEPLPSWAAEALAYTRALVAFEGPLRVHDDEDELDWDDPHAFDRDVLSADLEFLRRYHPMGQCSMDTWPQKVSQARAKAASRAGRTGWAVQGWLDTVGYWSSPRMVWSSYGQQHPHGHLRLLDAVGVDPGRLLLGLLLDVPGPGPGLHLGDIRRVVPDLGPDFGAELRARATDPALDPFNRAILLAAVVELPVEDDPLFAELPASSQAFLRVWAR